jgi:DNA/RNA endonuclease G (NUC1)
MRGNLRTVAFIAAAFTFVSCSDRELTSPVADTRQFAELPPLVHISELHYDNTGTDAGEAIEISGPAGTSLTGWSLVLYNGAATSRLRYQTINLTGTIPDLCNGRGVLVFAAVGMQNGDPDGVALVNGATVIEFLSYGGSFTAADGPAAGIVSTDMGVKEPGAVGESLQRDELGVWRGPVAATFGACNPAPEVGPITTVTVAPANASIVVGGAQQFTATATDAQGRTVTTTFTWSSTVPAIADVNATGLAIGFQAGDVTITATADGVSGQAALHVTQPVPLPAVRFSEIHYDNAGTDADEAIEVEGPAGTDLSGWSVVLYNGGNGAAYRTDPLNGVIVERCNGRGVAVVNYPSNGIQNGNPDAFALVDASGTVVEFLSYGGAFTAVGGPAAGQTSADIGVTEPTTTPAGQSLWRNSAGAWQPAAASSFGACNENDVPPPPPPPGPPLVINELMADPLRAPGGASWGEWFEVHNTGSEPIDLQGWTILSSGQPAHTVNSSVIVPAGGFAVLGRGNDPALNGGITLDYNYFTGSSTTIFLDGDDWLVLRDASGARVDSVRWSSSSIARGITRALRDASAENADVNGANWGYSTTPFGAGDLGTPGAANGTLDNTPPVLANFITFSGRTASDPALPVGFEDQIFPTLRSGTGASIPSTFTWSSETPDVASVDANGVVRALAVGTAVFRATAADGTTGTYSLATRLGVASTTAQYDGNAEFGEPTDGDASDDFIVRRAQYTASYNRHRGSPNWVSYNLEATHFGNEDRCDCFTFDPSLPAAFTRITTADYTGAGTVAGFGIDRGHLARSFDRTSASLDNATTFYFSNIIAQASDQNQGPWAALENHLGNLAQTQNKEVYVIAGASGNQGTVKNEGKIVIPTHTWKVAVILPRNHGLSDINDVTDLEVVAVIMPNDPGVRNVNWETYKTTIDAVEALSGYDLLALLPNQIEIAIESGTEPPAGALDGPYTSSEGASVGMNAAASTDPDGDALTFEWSFGDGQSASGASVVHTFAQDGTYNVRLIVTDTRGLADTVFTTATVSNIAPAIAAFNGASLLPGERYTAAGSFTDPGVDPWSATVDYGDGAGAKPLTLNGKSFALSKTYNRPGTYTVTVRVSDDDGTSTATQTVFVLTGAQVVRNAITVVDQLVAEGKLTAATGHALKVILEQVARQFERGNAKVTAQQLQAFLNHLDAQVRARRIRAEDAAVIRSLIERVIRAAPTS